VNDGGLTQAFQPVTAPVENPNRALELLREQALTIVAQASAPHMASLLRGSPKPPLYAAYREYMEGVDLYVHRDMPGAYAHFVRAAQLDTSFTVAMLSAATIQTQYPGPGGADSILSQLSNERDALSPTSRLWLDMMLAKRRGDLNEVRRLVTELARLLPESVFPYMRAHSYLELGQVRDAAATIRAIDPERGWMNGFYSYWITRSMLDHMLGDQDSERTDVVQANRAYPQNVAIATMAARYFASAGRLAQAESLFDDVVALTPRPGWDAGSVIAVAALEAAAHGHEDWVPRARARGLAWLNQLPSQERAFERGLFGVTWMLYSIQAWPELETRLDRLLREEPSDLRWLAFRSLAAAHRGDTATAKAIDHSFALRFDSGKESRGANAYILFARARIAAQLGKREAAVGLLRQALAHGHPFSVYLHTELAFAPLRGYPPFERLIAPKD
jgi:tetratricopeptide (TPR) repeat protein